jgi:hypothetical protein
MQICRAYPRIEIGDNGSATSQVPSERLTHLNKEGFKYMHSLPSG